MVLAHGYESEMREARIGCTVLNRMAEVGKTESQAIVGEQDQREVQSADGGTCPPSPSVQKTRNSSRLIQ